MTLSVLCIADPFNPNAEVGIPLWQRRGADDFAHPIFPSSFLEPKAGGGGMGHDVAANGFYAGPGKHAAAVQIGCHNLYDSSWYPCTRRCV